MHFFLNLISTSGVIVDHENVFKTGQLLKTCSYYTVFKHNLKVIRVLFSKRLIRCSLGASGKVLNFYHQEYGNLCTITSDKQIKHVVFVVVDWARSSSLNQVLGK